MLSNRYSWHSIKPDKLATRGSATPHQSKSQKEFSFILPNENKTSAFFSTSGPCFLVRCVPNDCMFIKSSECVIVTRVRDTQVYYELCIHMTCMWNTSVFFVIFFCFWGLLLLPRRVNESVSHRFISSKKKKQMPYTLTHIHFTCTLVTIMHGNSILEVLYHCEHSSERTSSSHN